MKPKVLLAALKLGFCVYLQISVCLPKHQIDWKSWILSSHLWRFWVTLCIAHRTQSCRRQDRKFQKLVVLYMILKSIYLWSQPIPTHTNSSYRSLLFLVSWLFEAPNLIFTMTIMGTLFVAMSRSPTCVRKYTDAD